MRINEILNLYSLSTNPEELAKRDEFKQLGLHMDEDEYIQKILIKKTIGGLLNTDRIKRIWDTGGDYRMNDFLSWWFNKPETQQHQHTQKIKIPEMIERRWGRTNFYVSYLDFQVGDQIVRAVKLFGSDYGTDIFIAQSNYKILSQALKEKDLKRKARYGLHTTKWKDPTVVQIKPIIG